MSLENQSQLFMDQPVTRRGLLGIAVQAAGVIVVIEGACLAADGIAEREQAGLVAKPEPRPILRPIPLYGTTTANEIVDRKTGVPLNYKGLDKFVSGALLVIAGSISFMMGKHLDAPNPTSKQLLRRKVLEAISGHKPRKQYPDMTYTKAQAEQLHLDETRVKRIITEN